MIRSLARWVVGVGAVGLLIVLFSRSLADRAEARQQFIDRLQQTEQADATLNQDVLKARYGYLTNYDPLVADLQELQALCDELGAAPPLPDHEDQLARTTLAALRQRLAEKDRLIEDVKSNTAILNNSFHYLAVAEVGLIDSKSDPALATSVGDLLRDALLSSLLHSKEAGPRLRQRLDAFRAAEHPPAIRSQLDLLIAHVETILKYKDRTDRLTVQVVETPFAQACAELTRLHEAAYRAEIASANTYRIGLFVYGAGLLGYAAWNWLRLRASAAALNRANDTLERRVQERTSALRRSNEELALEVGERRRAEEESLVAKELAEAANGAKSNFLAKMSHELRTPLNSVIGFANVLLKNKTGNLGEKDLGYLGRILDNGKHLLGLVNTILDLAKIEDGKLELVLTSVHLDVLVQEVVDQMEGQVKEQTVKLETETPPNLAPVQADADKLKQVLINLIGNALKFTAVGSVRVRVLADDSGSRARAVEVVDTGIGIPPDRQQAIFEAFEQADNSTTRSYGGTGLGLTISRSLCELMGYGLTVRSTVGQGSTFSILLPGEAPAPVAPCSTAELRNALN